MEGLTQVTTVKKQPTKLAGRFEHLVRMLPPRAIRNDREHEGAVEVIDRLMARPKLTKGQELYLETMLQLVQAYEAEHHAIEVSDLSGIDSLRHLLGENEMNASDLARLLGVHPSMGSKILNGERSLTVEHLRKLSDRFKVNAALFID